MRRTATSAGALVLLLVACGEPAAVDEAPAAAPVEPAVAPEATVEAAPAAAAGSALEPLPRPDLSPLKQTVQRQVERELAELEPLIADPAPEVNELAERFGRLGRVYHAYGLLDPALVAYRNAERLAASDPRWPYLQAAVATKQGRTESAERHLGRTLELAPEDLPSLLRLAELRLTVGRLEEAEELFQAALELDPDSAAATHGLARLATSRGDHQAAVALLRRVVELQPAATAVHTLLATAYRRLGDRQAAERHLAQRGAMPVIFEDPLVDGLSDLLQGVGIHLERGLRAFGDRRYEDAISEYRAALELEPENPTALRSLALTLATAGRHDEAIERFEDMLEVHPDHQLARLEYATVLLQRGRTEEAIANLERAIRIDPDFKDAHFNLATAHSRLGRWQEAADGFREALRIDRDDVAARLNLGIALDELGRPEEAVGWLQRAVAADPDNLRGRQGLGAVLEKLGRADEALVQFRAVLALDAPDQEKGLAHYQIGRLLSATGRDDEALASFERAVELFPQFWQARFAVANWLGRHGRHAEATAIFARLAAADPSNLLLRRREAESLMREGRFGRARQRLEEGLTEHPRSYELASLLARLLATAPDPALRDGQRALELAQQLLAAHRSIAQAETVAMALAELQRFDEAATFQREIIGWAESAGDVESARRLRGNLERYRNRQPARQAPG